MLRQAARTGKEQSSNIETLKAFCEIALMWPLLYLTQ